VEPGHPFLGPGGLDWAREQLAEAGWSETNVAHLTRKVHETLAPYAAADLERTVEAMPVIAELLLGRELTEEMWEPGKHAARTHTWVPGRARGIHPGDVVRVRRDAYPGGDAMAAHNGRQGRVSALRNGVMVVYDGAPRATMGIRHPPDKLEVQVPIRRRVTQ
jgi:hypothetical protein